ncbi:ribosome-associated translation inhibitor RaiA [Candidatus Sumerlaeota bacterium]|nr:ribosome-associated translation inhibitor RaiA [Candidatus Sumerlaeota bacterium]
MPLQITGRHTTVSQSQRDYIEKKVERLRKLVSRIDEIAFIVSTEKARHLVEINLRAGKIKTFVKCDDAEPIAAIDKAIDRAVAQISKAKGKRADKKKNGAPSVRRPRPSADED